MKISLQVAEMALAVALACAVVLPAQQAGLEIAKAELASGRHPEAQKQPAEISKECDAAKRIELYEQFIICRRSVKSIAARVLPWQP